MSTKTTTTATVKKSKRKGLKSEVKKAQEIKTSFFELDPLLNREKQLHQTIKTIEDFRKIEFGKYTTCTILYEVYSLLSEEYEQRLCDFKFYTSNLLKIFADPKVNKAITESCNNHHLKESGEMLYRLHDFWEMMDNPIYKSMFLIEDITQMPSRYSTEKLKCLREDYEARILVAKTGKIKNYY